MFQGSHPRSFTTANCCARAGFGFADLEQQRPMRGETLIDAGSVTKTAACIAVMQLWVQRQWGGS
jgi:hypothetical protein